MHSRGVAQVVQAWLHATLTTQPSLHADSPERALESADVHSPSIVSHKEWNIGLVRVATGAAPVRILDENLNGFGAEWHESTLEELRITNGEVTIREIDVGDHQ